MALCPAPDTNLLTILQIKLAAEICGVPLTIIVAPQAPLIEALKTHNLPSLIETEEILATHLNDYERLRHLGQPSESLLRAAHTHHVPVLCDPVTRNGRLELRYYLREQAVCETLHRYGNIMPKPKVTES
jgi:RHH-type proline utilization regulon transcriptional repressor/proline dehydrogenase/delta 1-pyrroline-5-carboxylate dehydrogenase